MVFEVSIKIVFPTGDIWTARHFVKLLMCKSKSFCTITHNPEILCKINKTTKLHPTLFDVRVLAPPPTAFSSK